MVESAPLLDQESTCDHGLSWNRTMIHPQSEITARRKVWQLEAFGVIQFPFQLVALFEKERGRGKADTNCAQQSLRNADVAILSWVHA
jgi:hypothetical protein